MFILIIAALFVVGGLYVRRHYGGAALAALWLATTVLAAATSSAGFLLMVSRLGTQPSAQGRGLAIAFMLLVDGASFGASAIAINVARREEGPWLTPAGILWGVIGFAAGGVVAYGLVIAAIALLGSTVAR